MTSKPYLLSREIKPFLFTFLGLFFIFSNI
ncbi:TPA: SVM family protein [Staphylococcus delphini]|nr:SVM family protein [Staphylococcus delphini]HEC2176421.1 SVM family protein [Staphylococcus delphini]